MPIVPPNIPPESTPYPVPISLEFKKTTGFVAKKDYFVSLDELKSKLSEDKDYSIVFIDRNAKATIVAPHGGGIEAGTSEIARAIAGKRYNLFDFLARSLKARKCGHVTSTHFRDKRLSKLLNKSQICVSIHRMRDEHSTLYLGGANRKLKKLAAKELAKYGFQYTVDPPRLKGLSRKNFVNMANQAGLQIEIPKLLANKLIPNVDVFYKTNIDYKIQDSGSKEFIDFVKAIDSAIEAYLSKQN